ncbi:DUF2316 family protein [Aquibacillus koreensis]|uniref:DUF2316 family protein n=1 Tax=Aquibacillus koreensis TaxID=279446 RepID=A0A9X3WGH6_9BACI|nr:DUF2316 family protein [Aquibacillus koreensis]MCT2536485.1 DUF2316 family protein [Aquibacillus koreensis]MDC3419427.1 DUF2316 family protein [Aquibacillus koreensis]
MSLTPEQRNQVGKEIGDNLKLAGLTPEVVQADLAFNHAQYEETVKFGPTANEEEVARLRNYLAEKVKEQGKEPYSYT